MSSQKFCVYLIVYHGNKLPLFYIGQTQILKLERGYRGQVGQREYSKIWKKETKTNPHLFSYKIIASYSTRKEALEKELILQKHLKVVDHPLYANKQYAIPNGYFGRDLSGQNNPNYKKQWSDEQKLKASIRSKKCWELGLLKPRPAMPGESNPRFGDKRQTFKNKDGKTICVVQSDPRVLSGEYVGISKGIKSPIMAETKRKDLNLKKYKSFTFIDTNGNVIQLSGSDYQIWIKNNKINVMDYIRSPNTYIKNYKLIHYELNPHCNIKQPTRKQKFKYIILKCPDNTTIKLEAPYLEFFTERKLNLHKIYSGKSHNGYQIIETGKW